MSHQEFGTQEKAIRHALLGAGCAALNILIIYIGTSVLHEPYQLAAAITVVITIPTAYFLSRNFVFKVSTPPTAQEFIRFLSQQLAQFLIGIILLAAGVELLGITPTISMSAATAILWGISFISQLKWVFRKASTGAPPRSVSNASLRLVVVTHFFPAHGGGLEKVAEKIVQYLPLPEFRITWISSDTDRTPDLRCEGIRFISAPTNNIIEKITQLPYPIWAPKALTCMWREIGDADVVHIHEHLYFPSIIALAIARIRGRPVVITQHMGALALGNRLITATYEIGARLLGALIFPLTSRTIFISNNVLHFFKRNNSNNARLIFNGVDTSIFNDTTNQDRTNIRIRLGLPVDKKIVLFVGRFVKKKGIRRILALSKRLNEITFVFVGAGPEAPDEDIGNVIVAGRVEHDQLAQYYQSADLLLLPSAGEGLPLVVQEALCCGTGVLSTDEVGSACPEASDLIRTRPVPRLEDDIDGWQKALVDTLHDDKYIYDRAHRSSRAHSLWSWRKCSTEYSRIFREISPSS